MNPNFDFNNQEDFIKKLQQGNKDLDAELDALEDEIPGFKEDKKNKKEKKDIEKPDNSFSVETKNDDCNIIKIY